MNILSVLLFRFYKTKLQTKIHSMSKIKARLLVIDDDPDILLAAKMFLRQHFDIVHTEKNPVNIPNLLKNNNYDVILLDMNFTRDATSGQEGFHWLNVILDLDPAAIVIFITGYGDIELAVQGIKEGATHFILKPWDNKKLQATIESSLRIRESKVELETLKSTQKVLIADQDQAYNNLVSRSPAMKKVMKMALKVAKTDANVLILGENGTGKEVVARAIHRASPRHENVFVSVDLGAITETLFESELFGYKKGAFTDAKEDRAGRFEVARKGTLFLDEIGNLSPNLQSKLLSVMQNRKVVRLGSNKEIPVDVRLICATNMPLYEMVKENKFRQDLLYRINTVEIALPPLRERHEDIEPLVEYYLEVYCKKYNLPKKRLGPGTKKRLQKHNWPGNIRELQHAVERAVILSETNILDPRDFFMDDRSDKPDTDFTPDNMNLEEVEKIMVQKVIDKHGGNISRAAKELGLTRASLYRRIEKYGI